MLGLRWGVWLIDQNLEAFKDEKVNVQTLNQNETKGSLIDFN
jgi:hypothetical protein